MNKTKGRKTIIIGMIAFFVIAIVGVVAGSIMNEGMISIVAICAAFLVLAGFLVFDTISRKAAEKRAKADGEDTQFLRRNNDEADMFEQNAEPLFRRSNGRNGFSDNTFDDYGEDTDPFEDFGEQDEQPREYANMFARPEADAFEEMTDAAEAAEVQPMDEEEAPRPKRLPFGARERRARAAQAAEEQKAAELLEEQLQEQRSIEEELQAKADAEAAELAEAQAAAQAAMAGRDILEEFSPEERDDEYAPMQDEAEVEEEENPFRPVLKLDTPEAKVSEAAVPAAAAASAAASVQPVVEVQGQSLESFFDMDEEDLLYRDCVEVWAADAKPCVLRLIKYIESIEDKHTQALFGRECEYINAMIDRIMYFTHLEEIDEMLDIKEYNFKSMVMECLKRFSPFLIEKKLGLLWKGLDMNVMTDRRWFIFALTQIIFNSVEFTPESGKIAITAKQTDDYVDLIIDDSGKGISAEEMPYIFIAGYMGDESPNVAGRRTGMGLFIARSVMNKMGGDVFAESSPGKSTRVIMRMPMKVQ